MEIGNLASFLLDSPGPGGVVVMTVLISALIIYYRLTRWILGGRK